MIRRPGVPNKPTTQPAEQTKPVVQAAQPKPVATQVAEPALTYAATLERIESGLKTAIETAPNAAAARAKIKRVQDDVAAILAKVSALVKQDAAPEPAAEPEEATDEADEDDDHSDADFGDLPSFEQEDGDEGDARDELIARIRASDKEGQDPYDLASTEAAVDDGWTNPYGGEGPNDGFGNEPIRGLDLRSRAKPQPAPVIMVHPKPPVPTTPPANAVQAAMDALVDDYPVPEWVLDEDEIAEQRRRFPPKPETPAQVHDRLVAERARIEAGKAKPKPRKTYNRPAVAR